MSERLSNYQVSKQARWDDVFARIERVLSVDEAADFIAKLEIALEWRNGGVEITVRNGHPHIGRLVLENTLPDVSVRGRDRMLPGDEKGACNNRTNNL